MFSGFGIEEWPSIVSSAVAGKDFTNTLFDFGFDIEVWVIAVMATSSMIGMYRVFPSCIFCGFIFCGCLSMIGVHWKTLMIVAVMCHVIFAILFTLILMIRENLICPLIGICAVIMPFAVAAMFDVGDLVHQTVVSFCTSDNGIHDLHCRQSCTSESAKYDPGCNVACGFYCQHGGLLDVNCNGMIRYDEPPKEDIFWWCWTFATLANLTFAYYLMQGAFRRFLHKERGVPLLVTQDPTFNAWSKSVRKEAIADNKVQISPSGAIIGKMYIAV